MSILCKSMHVFCWQHINQLHTIVNWYSSSVYRHHQTQWKLIHRPHESMPCRVSPITLARNCTNGRIPTSNSPTSHWWPASTNRGKFLTYKSSSYSVQCNVQCDGFVCCLFRFRAHRLIVAAVSPYLANLLLQLAENDIVVVPNVDWQLLQMLIRYCYIGKIVISSARGICMFCLFWIASQTIRRNYYGKKVKYHGHGQWFSF